jgi:hypothetical protein
LQWVSKEDHLEEDAAAEEEEEDAMEVDAEVDVEEEGTKEINILIILIIYCMSGTKHVSIFLTFY